MNPQQKNYKLAIGIIILGVVFLGFILYMFFKSDTPPQSQGGEHNQDTTTINSPVSKNKIDFTVNYGSDIEPNMYAVEQPFKIFSLDGIEMPQVVKGQVETFLIDALREQVAPTYASTFVHIEKGSIKCQGEFACTMNVYIDSPEKYFEFSIKDVDQIPSYTLKPMAWKGITE